MTFHSFDSFDDMLAFMRESERQANARTTPAQRNIGYGSYWVRSWQGVMIFGYVPSMDEIMDQERDLGASDAEIRWEVESLENAYERGYRYGKCYSVIEPLGEWGSTHVSAMIEIPKEIFEAAQEAGWLL